MFRELVRVSVLAALGALPIAVDSKAEDDVGFETNVEYGRSGDVPLRLNVARPKDDESSSPRPAIVFIHGGAWSGGKKELHDADIKALARRGYLAVTIGYRLAPAHRFPAQIEDCKCAVRWLRSHASELRIDPDRIGAVGASAGAHLAMMLGAMNTGDGLEGDGGWPDQPSAVQAVVSFAGPTNLQAAFPEVSARIIENFLGGPLDKTRDQARAASPISYVSPGDAPMLLFQGSKDDLVPLEQAFEMATALTKAGVPGRVEILVGAGHGWGSPDRERTMASMYAFLDRYLRSP